jgi:hypothetical protein
MSYMAEQEQREVPLVKVAARKNKAAPGEI